MKSSVVVNPVVHSGTGVDSRMVAWTVQRMRLVDNTGGIVVRSVRSFKISENGHWKCKLLKLA